MNLTEEQQRQCREAFKAENYVITAVDLFGNGDLFDFVNIYRDGFAAGLAAARGEAVVLNVSAWGNDDKTYVSTTKKHPSGDIEVTTSEASPPPQPASERITGSALDGSVSYHVTAEELGVSAPISEKRLLELLKQADPETKRLPPVFKIFAKLIQAEGK